jgi:histidinol-phosphate aminotransferase
MASSPRPRSGIMKIDLYQGGKSAIKGVASPLKLSSNENLAGPSDAAREAFARAVHKVHLYPSTDHASLRAAIAAVHGLDADQIICGVGSDEIIHFLCQAYGGARAQVIHTQHGFLMYRISALASGATPVEVAETNRTVDVPAILAAVTEQTKLVFIANPANPTGTMLPMAALRALADGLPQHVILVLDGAYAEFAAGYDGGASLAGERANVVMLRTFSKAYGLGGLRVGWAYGPRVIIDVLNRVRGPFNLSSVALEVAEAAMRDQAYIAGCATDNARGRGWLQSELANMGIGVDESHANFVLARFADEAEARAVDAHLQGAGIIARHVANYGLPHALRITIADEASCRRVAHAIAQFKGLK